MGMWRRFEFKQGTSHKFWEIYAGEYEIIIRFGRAGSAGTRQSKTYREPEEIRVEAERRIAEKLSKGYEETNAAAPRFVNSGSPPEKPPKLKMPPVLEPYRALVEGSMLQCIKILPGKKSGLKPWNSKVAGPPYLPAGHPYPMRNGQPLALLAQLNFEEIPPLRDFPEKGILRFYVDARDSLIGLDFDDRDKQDGFRVLYFPKVEKRTSKLEQDSQRLKDSDVMEYSPAGMEIGLRFRKESIFISPRDFRFEELFDPTLELDFEVKFFREWPEIGRNFYKTDFQKPYHQIGGYPFFTQTDPRENKKWHDHEVLLFQLDSQDAMGVQWGDFGIGNFFIKRSDLRKRDFSRVLYNWDCH